MFIHIKLHENNTFHLDSQSGQWLYYADYVLFYLFVFSKISNLAMKISVLAGKAEFLREGCGARRLLVPNTQVSQIRKCPKYANISITHQPLQVYDVWVIVTSFSGLLSFYTMYTCIGLCLSFILSNFHNQTKWWHLIGQNFKWLYSIDNLTILKNIDQNFVQISLFTD